MAKTQAQLLFEFIQSRRRGNTKSGKFISVDFTKKDGSIRKLRFNPCELTGFVDNPSQTAKDSIAKNKINYPTNIRVRDADLPADARWRTIVCENVTRIAFDGQVYTF